MSKCDLRIELESSDRIFTPGQTLRGHVEVDVNARCQCNGLTLSREWRTHGRGNRASGAARELTLFSGTWQPGETYSYAFEVEIPESGPLSYHGHYLNVDWYLDARADIPWAFDPKAQAEVLVVPGEEPCVGEAQSSPTLAAPGSVQNIIIGCAVAFLSIFILAGMGVSTFGVLFAVGFAGEGGEPALFMIPFGLAFATIPCIMVFFLLRNVIAQRKLGPVNLIAEPDVVVAGDTVSFSVGFTPRSEAHISSVVVTLRGSEVVVSGSGTNRSTHTHVLHAESQTLEAGSHVRALEQVSLQGELLLPADAPASFSASDNALVWEVEVHIDIARWPDYQSSVPVRVRG